MNNPLFRPKSDENIEEILRGEVSRITYRNDANGYVVLQVAVPDQRERITVVGNATKINEGSPVIIRGIFRNHPKFGKQLVASSITETPPETVDGLIKYLGSGTIKGIGESTAKRIVREFGSETMEVILRTPERVANLKGVGPSKAKLLTEAFAGQSEMREIYRFLLEHNITQNLATKIFERYGSRSIETLSKDPYILARLGGIRGVGFKTADEIAKSLGFEFSSLARLRAGIYHALEKSLDDGHCFLTVELLFERARALLSLHDEDDLLPHLQTLLEESAVVRDNDKIYLPPLFRAEVAVSEFVALRCNRNDTPFLDPSLVADALKAGEESLGITYSEEQRSAVLDATHYPLVLITGGPGCGKTTVIKALSLVFKYAGKRLALAAPTGRAAQRMSQVCGLPASTIHRLLKFDPRGGGFTHGVNDPLPIDGIIVDEASMIDLSLAKDLFSAIPRNAPLILVGDKDQLPSVGPGKVFGDLLSLKELRTVSLSRLFRRAEESSINSIAFQVNSGIVPTIPEPDGITKTDAYFIPKSDAEEAGSLIEKLVAEQIPKKFGIDSKDIVVLTPSNRGPLGIQSLNARLQARLNPKADEEQEIELNGTILRLGDRVCQRVNNYQIDHHGVYNGDMGEIYSIDRATRSLQVELWDGRIIKYDSAALGQLSLAYAVTVHRSQGSEIPCVVLALHESHYSLLERQLIYTGITRAKKVLIVVGSKRALSIASKRTTTSRRCTYLRDRVRQALTTPSPIPPESFE